MAGGARSQLWLVEVAGKPCVARRVTVGEPSLRWLVRLQTVAVAQGLRLAPLHPGNVLRLSGGGLALVDWEEARIADMRLDLGFPRNAAGRAAHAAAEVAACWRVEPDRARRMARILRAIGQVGGLGRARR